MELYDFNSVLAIKNAKPRAKPTVVESTMVTILYKKIHRRLMYTQKSTVEEAYR